MQSRERTRTSSYQELNYSSLWKKDEKSKGKKTELFNYWLGGIIGVQERTIVHTKICRKMPREKRHQNKIVLHLEIKTASSKRSSLTDSALLGRNRPKSNEQHSLRVPYTDKMQNNSSYS